ncbi:amino acid ABC transporter permease [Nocardioides agariphilus]|uniref:Amino acid ABC transporter permease n=1 Tax=Nocardioides agariphilus TaxID=433664 RepID=A0A930YIF1_9ACTN|nr:amino acid ABC transporter permease [Nocardioides agariphilus]
MNRTQRRRVRDGALYAVLTLALVGAAVVTDWEAVTTNFLDGPTWRAMWPEIVTVAVWNTVTYTVISFVFAFAVALVLAFMKLSPLAVYRWLATAYIEFFRGLPALVVIFFMAFAVPLAFHWIPPGGLVGAGIVGLIVTYAAYMAETLRAGIQAVPKGQREAAQSLGMNGAWTTVSVILPQAIRIVIPPLTNELVALIKDTSLLFVVGMQADQVELSAFGQNNTVTFANASPLLAIALFYLVVTLPMTRLVAWLERRQQRAR